MTLEFKTKDELIACMIGTMESTVSYLVDMEQDFGEDHTKEIVSLKTLIKAYKQEASNLITTDNSTKE